jgi:hypothetical protein
MNLALLVLGLVVLRYYPRRTRFMTIWAWAVTIWGAFALVMFVLARSLRRFSPEAMARQLFARQKTLYSGVHEHRVVGPEALAGFDADFYARTQAAFEALGFRHVADLVDETSARVFTGLRSVRRVMTNADGDAVVHFWQILSTHPPAAPPTPKRKSMELTTDFTDGTSVWTFDGERSDTMTDWPWIRRFFLGRGTTPAELVEQHRRHVAAALEENPARRVVPQRTLEEVLAGAEQMQLRQNDYKRRTGYISGNDLYRILGARLNPAQEQVVAELEKLRAEAMAECGVAYQPLRSP